MITQEQLTELYLATARSIMQFIRAQRTQTQ